MQYIQVTSKKIVNQSMSRTGMMSNDKSIFSPEQQADIIALGMDIASRTACDQHAMMYIIQTLFAFIEPSTSQDITEYLRHEHQIEIGGTPPLGFVSSVINPNDIDMGLFK